MQQSVTMTDYSDSATAGIRLSDDDREKAVRDLARAHSDGRVTAEEYTERSTVARAAVTRGDLAPLFADLPGPVPGPAPAAAYPTKPGDGTFDAPSRTRPLGGTAGVVAVSVTPLIVLVIFLLVGFFVPHGWNWAWVFWLAVPIVGIIVYGPSGRRDRD